MAPRPNGPFGPAAAKRIGTIEAFLVDDQQLDGFNVLKQEEEVEVRIALSFAEWIKQLNYLPESCDIRKRITEAIFCVTKGLKGVF